MIHGAVNARNTFDPRTSKRSFTVGMTDIGEIYFLPQLMQREPTQCTCNFFAMLSGLWHHAQAREQP